MTLHVIAPLLDTIPTIVVESWLKMELPLCTTWHITRNRPVDEAYCELFLEAASDPLCHHILTIEHDNVPQPDSLMRLMKRAYANPKYLAIGALYYTKGEKGVPQIWGPPGFMPQQPKPGLVECNAVGMGFTLWDPQPFRELQIAEPWFKTTGVEDSPNGLRSGMSQDLYFWDHARGFGFRCAVDCDIRVGHYESSCERIW